MNNNDIPWIESYRPNSLAEVIGQDDIVTRLKRWSDAIKAGNKGMPHMLFAGRTPGIGKTSVAKAFMKDAFGEGWTRNFHYLNASDERGIKVIRTTIKDWARTTVIPDDQLGRVFNVIFLDEADYLTNEAQAAMRAMMEELIGTCRFILSCNYLSKIIEPIRNRCLGFRFKPLTEQAITDILVNITGAEDIDIEADAVFKIAENARGSARSAINVLNDLSLIPATITEEDVQNTLYMVDIVEVKSLLKMAMTASLEDLDKAVMELYSKGHTGTEIFDALHDLLLETGLPEKTKRQMLAKMMEIEFHIAMGCNELRQLRGFFIWLSLKAK